MEHLVKIELTNDDEQQAELNYYTTLKYANEEKITKNKNRSLQRPRNGC